MKISNLVLHNFRKYEHARFNFHDQFTVLIGDNGAGKTTILDALSLMLGTYLQGSKIKTGRSVIGKEEARLFPVEKEGQSFLEPAPEVYLTCESLFRERPLFWRRDLGDRGGKAKDLVNIGTEDRLQISRKESPDLPLLLYYGAGRLWDIHRNIETEKPRSQLDAYRFCLDPKSDQKAFEKWFKKLSFTEIQKKQSIPALEAVKASVLACIPDAVRFFHDIDDDLIVIDLQSTGLMPFNYLSDGYRNMVGMVADIAHRASRLNPQYGADAARETSGVVLIDEIDLHLHPSWQRRVVGDLQAAFPKLQFIATTHSPFILQSLDPGEVIDLDHDVALQQIETAPVGIAAPGPGHEFSSRPIEDIVEEVMGVPVPQRSRRYQEMYDAAKEYYRVLRQTQGADERVKVELKARLDELSAPFSENVAYHAFLEMERLDAGLGRSQKPEGK